MVIRISSGTSDDPRRRNGPIPGHQHEEQQEGNHQIDQPAKNGGEWDDQPGEVDLAQHVDFLDQTAAGVVQGIREIHPRHQAGQAEQRIGRSVGADSRHSSKDDGEEDHRNEGLDDRPSDSQDRLRVAHLHVPPHQEVEQLTVLPQLDHFGPESPALRPDDGGRAQQWRFGRVRRGDFHDD